MGQKKRYRVAVFVTLLLFISLFAATVLEARTLYWGTRGEDVRQVQQRLKTWGYGIKSVDGIYGNETFQAVKKFQQRNGLTVDGVVGPATLRALGLGGGRTAPVSRSEENRATVNNNDVLLLARAIHGEARGEPYVGMVAVGAVILNRVRHPSFPNTIAGVIYQPLAFTAVADGQINLPPGKDAIRAAHAAMNGWDPSGGALYYYNPAKATSSWIWSRPTITVIGKHVFAR
jgi:N-acetylmuramoyl-L-alanine amidase